MPPVFVQTAVFQTSDRVELGLHESIRFYQAK